MAVNKLYFGFVLINLTSLNFEQNILLNFVHANMARKINMKLIINPLPFWNTYNFAIWLILHIQFDMLELFVCINELVNEKEQRF